MRNLLSRVHKAQSQMVAALVRTIFAQADKDAVAAQLDEVASRLEHQFPDVAAMLLDTREDVCAFASFPRAHWTKIWSTNSIERLNAEIKRRTRVVGIFPNDSGALRTHHRRLRRDPRGMAGRREALHVRGFHVAFDRQAQRPGTGGDLGDYAMTR